MSSNEGFSYDAKGRKTDRWFHEVSMGLGDLERREAAERAARDAEPTEGETKPEPKPNPGS